MSDQPAKRRRRGEGRSAAEWTTLVLSAVVVVALAGLVSAQYLGTQRPAVIEATPRLDALREDAGLFYLPVDIANRGEQAAEEVLVRVTVRNGEDEESAELTVPLLAGGGAEEGVTVFRIRPIEGGIDARVIAFLRP